MSVQSESVEKQSRDGLVAKSGLRHRRSSAGALCVALTFPLAACGVNRTIPPPIAAYDYHDRHPVLLAEAPTTIDIYPSARLDGATVGRIREFVERYHRLGHGQITLLAPAGDSAVRRSGVQQVRRILAASGANGSLYIGTYPVSDPGLAAPVRLSFQGIKAKVADRCGEWPADLASGSSLQGWENTSYWNFGCANQATLAAQVADPRDLAAPRAETPSDTEMRMRAIGAVRKGADPTTKWTQKAPSISTIGGD
jgi:pilus assembly protein CpaD